MSDILRITVEELAAEGNEKAQMALKLAQKLPGYTPKNVRAKLRAADDFLAQALAHNDNSWTHRTDRAIEGARSCILDVLTYLR